MFRNLLIFGAGMIVGALGASWSLGFLKGIDHEFEDDAPTDRIADETQADNAVQA